MNFLIFLLLGLAAAASLVSMRGRRVNQDLKNKFAACLLETLEPSESSMTDIGGAVGFTFEFLRSRVPERVAGSLTLFPRQAMFYYPIARFLMREDALSLLAPMPRLPIGEGHLLHRRRWEDGAIDVDDADGMERSEIGAKDTDFIVLSYNVAVRDILRRFAGGFPYPADLRHFSYSRANDSFFLHIVPRQETLDACLEYWICYLHELSSLKANP